VGKIKKQSKFLLIQRSNYSAILSKIHSFFGDFTHLKYLEIRIIVIADCNL